MAPSPNSKYNVVLSLKLQDASESEKEPFSETHQLYRELDYEEVLLVQKALADSLVNLGFQGLEKLKRGRPA